MAIVGPERGAVDPSLHVDGFGLSIGRVSVGLPTACTADVVLLRYLDLLRLLHREAAPPPDDDIEALARATGLTETQTRERLRRLQG